MNREDIEQWTREAGGFDATPEFLAKFAALVASAEREEIIAIAESSEFNRIRGEFSPTSSDLLNAIKARG
jgi:hypothetical protein